MKERQSQEFYNNLKEKWTRCKLKLLPVSSLVFVFLEAVLHFGRNDGVCEYIAEFLLPMDESQSSIPLSHFSLRILSRFLRKPSWKLGVIFQPLILSLSSKMHFSSFCCLNYPLKSSSSFAFY